MNKYKRYIPIAAIVLLALGVNLEQFGIDLEALSRGGGNVTTSSTSATSDRDSSTIAGSGAQAFDHQDFPKWTSTEPNINQWHIFAGEINRSGKPVGFHSRPAGLDPVGARVKSVREQPNRSGVYTATIEIRDGQQWKEKFSSFFPDSLSRDEVISAVLHAYRNSPDPNAQPFEGPSGLGFEIQGYTSSRGGINTAYPIHVRD